MSCSRGEIKYAVIGAAFGLAVGVALERFCSRGTNKGLLSKAFEDKKSSSDVVKSGNNIMVDKTDLERCISACIQKVGAVPEKANLVAQVLVAADCRGIPSHGVNRAEMYCNEMKAGLIKPNAEPVIVTETSSTANIDAQNGLGAVASSMAIDLCIKKAKATGIGCVVCHNSNHYGIAGFWSEIALKEGLVAFSFTNTSPFMVPTRGVERAGGTNPIAFYCPAQDDSFQLDMATTTVPVGKVEVVHRKGDDLPTGWAVDRHGSPTNDPAEVLERGGLTPLGGLEETAGYKGYGLNMMVEILCAVLSGCKKVGPDVPLWRVDRGEPTQYGHCFICIDPEKLVPDGEFQASLTSYLARMRGVKRADSNVAVLVPGDPEKAEEKAAAKNGVKLNESIALGVRTLVRDLGCDDDVLPCPLRGLPERDAPKHLCATMHDKKS